MKRLEDDQKFKQSIIEELKSIGEEIDLKPLVREYIECLCRVHTKVRELIEDDSMEWERTTKGVIDRFKTANPDETSLAGLALIAQSDEGEPTNIVHIFEDFLERISQLKQKNREYNRLANRLVSG